MPRNDRKSEIASQAILSLRAYFYVIASVAWRSRFFAQAKTAKRDCFVPRNDKTPARNTQKVL